MFDEATSYKLIDTNSFDRFKDLSSYYIHIVIDIVMKEFMKEFK